MEPVSAIRWRDGVTRRARNSWVRGRKCAPRVGGGWLVSSCGCRYRGWKGERDAVMMDGLDWGMMVWSAETGLGVRMADDCGGGLSVADGVVAWYIIRMRGLRIEQDV
jgi:hypothetical protein